jgi:hypothetical protein
MGSLNTPQDVAAVLTEQALIMRGKIDALSEALDALEKLKTETLKMKTVNFKTYADIVMLLQQKNDNYWILKYFDEKTLSHIRNNIDEEHGGAIIATWQRLCGEIADMQKDGLMPEYEQGQRIAKEWWDMVMAFMGGDMSLLPGLVKFAESKGG